MSNTKPRTAAQSKALAALTAPGSMGRRTAGATAAALDASPAALAALVRQGLARVCGTWRDDLSGAPARYRITSKGMAAAESDAEATTGGITVTDTEGRTATARRLDDLYIVRDDAGVTLGSATSVLDEDGQRVWRDSTGRLADALWIAVRRLAGMNIVAHVRPAEPESATAEADHSDYPHWPGTLYDCPACEARCYCDADSAECVYSGEHATTERTTDKGSL